MSKQTHRCESAPTGTYDSKSVSPDLLGRRRSCDAARHVNHVESLSSRERRTRSERQRKIGQEEKRRLKNAGCEPRYTICTPRAPATDWQRESETRRARPGSGRRTTSGRGSRRDLSGAQPGQAFLTPFALIYPRIYPRIDILSFKYFSAGE